MRHDPNSHSTHLPIDAGGQVAQLRHVLKLVEELAGECARRPPSDAALDESARISSLYDGCEPIVRRRFFALAAETAAWSAAGV